MVDSGTRVVPAYLSVCSTYRDHASYLSEWIEFHLLVGVERLFLYDNGSTDDHLDVLAPYISAGIVVVHDWPGTAQQHPAFRDCLERHANDARWIAFIDIDEFLFSPTKQSLREILPEYEQWPGVVVNWVVYGTSGHERRPAGLVTESYLRRGPLVPTYKTIVDPKRATGCQGAHHFTFEGGDLPVDENKVPVTGAKTDRPSISRLRINHYYTKSEQELREKWSKPRPDTGEARDQTRLTRFGAFNAIPDPAILDYVPALRRALAVRGEPNSNRGK